MRLVLSSALCILGTTVALAGPYPRPAAVHHISGHRAPAHPASALPPVAHGVAQPYRPAHAGIPSPHVGGDWAKPPRHRHGPRVPFVGFGYSPPPVTVVLPAAEPAPTPGRPMRPRSFNLTDPTAIVGRTPSGRVAFASGVGYGPGWGMGAPPEAAPYLPPSITVIGKPSQRHMRGRIRLDHGIAAPETLPTSPRVVFLKDVKR
jgi:hypothetical protein